MSFLARIAVVAVVAAVPVVGAPATAAAQDGPTDEQRAAAREAFEAGLAAARSGDWRLARDEFAEAYEAVPRPAVLFNLAGAQQRLGELAAAAASYRRFLAEVGDGPAAQHRATAERELAEIEDRIPHLTISVTNLAETDEVRVGDRVAARDALSWLPVDPGRHRVSVVRAGQVVVSGSIALAEGSSDTIELVAPPRVGTPEEAATAVVPTPEPERDIEPAGGDGGVLASPVFWVVAGAVVIGAVVAVVLLTASAGDDPFMGNFGQGRVEVP